MKAIRASEYGSPSVLKLEEVPKLPYTPGSGAAGVVEAVGSGVTGVKAGDRVYVGGTLTGAYAERSLCEQSQVHPLPAMMEPGHHGKIVLIPR